jgi:glycosyltransferase involved in cell wall biosynthesis
MGWFDRHIILNTARQEPQKGQIHLLEALPSILERAPDALLVIAGRSGRSSQEMKRKVGELLVGPHVAFLGVRDDVPDLMVAADVFAFPSLFEGLGGALLEAMALELPIVAFDTPAVNEALADGSCGQLVPVGDTDQLATALLYELERTEQERGETVVRARRRFEEVYELQTCLAQMSNLYRDIELQLPLRRRTRLRLSQ